MKIPHLFFLLALVGCQKTKQEVPQSITELTVIQETGITSANEKVIKTDTIVMYSDGKESADDYVLANLTDQKADKDSVVTVQYRLDFYQNKIKTTSSKITIKGFQKGSEWVASYGLNSEGSARSPFIQVSVGYPACGYTHENYLYYFSNNSLQLVHQWSTMTDSGWGSWVEIVSPKDDSNPKSFYCKTVAFEPTDNDNEDMGIVKYSDSISFELKDERWKKILLSSKDKPYFEKKMSFDEFHNQQ